MHRTIVGRFMLLAVGWLVLLLPGWYWLAEWFARPAIWLAGSAMDLLFAWADGWEQDGVTATLYTLVQVRVAGPHGDRLGELAPEVSYPTYGYGLVLFWALMLASRTRRGWLKGLLGTALLLPAQAWGICFQWLRDVVLLSGPDGAAYLGYSPLAENAVAYGYQFGFLMLPTVAPILLWLLFNKHFVAALWLEAALDRREPVDVTPPRARPADEGGGDEDGGGTGEPRQRV